MNIKTYLNDNPDHPLKRNSSCVKRKSKSVGKPVSCASPTGATNTSTIEIKDQGGVPHMGYSMGYPVKLLKDQIIYYNFLIDD